MYQMAMSWGLSPNDFWDMTVNEWFALFEVNRPNNFAGSLTHSSVNALQEDMELTDDEWWAKHGSSQN